MSIKTRAFFQKKLLSWYKENARRLPWRTTHDPYKIWVSEIMLQQTQVQTVIPYYKRWLDRFPDLASLAKASEDKVMKYWAGLGYYRRARMLHAGAKYILHERQGVLPSQIDELINIPGIGRYTAGAIASIAFGQKVPILDGNVIRILSRIFAVQKPIEDSRTIKILWGLSESLLPDQDIGDFNQALMELGATVCFPENPNCLTCPAKTICRAHLDGKETDFPVRARREKTVKKRMAALILTQNAKVLLQKQPKEGRWGGLWAFPFWENLSGLCRALNLESKNFRHCFTVEHGFTKYRIQLDVYELKSEKSEDKRTAFSSEETLHPHWHWVYRKRLTRLAFPSPHKKILSLATWLA